MIEMNENAVTQFKSFISVWYKKAELIMVAQSYITIMISFNTGQYDIIYKYRGQHMFSTGSNETSPLMSRRNARGSSNY
jgi:hypothetical protein